MAPDVGRDLAGCAQTAFDEEWERSYCKDSGSVLSFPRAGSDLQHFKLHHGGWTDAGATSAFTTTAEEQAPPGRAETGFGNRIEGFECKDGEDELSSQKDGSGMQRWKTDQWQKRHQCRFCPYSSHYITNVTAHERKHTGEKPFSCRFCQRAFSLRCNLIRHERIHTGEKPFRCQTCQQAFAVRDNLIAHERVHTGERPFRCCMCGSTFRQKKALKFHERTHTGERPYVCEACGKAFTHKGSLNVHRKSHMAFA